MNKLSRIEYVYVFPHEESKEVNIGIWELVWVIIEQVLQNWPQKPLDMHGL